MRKTFKFKLYCSKKTKILNQQINISASIWNHCISLHKQYYKLFGESLNLYKLQKHITKLKKQDKYNFWKNVPSQAIQDITERIDKSYKLFFRNLEHKIKTSPPKFCSYRKYKSFTLKQSGYTVLDNNRIKIGKQIFKYSKSRNIDGDIKTLTIKRNRLGEFYICFSVKIEDTPNERIMTGKNAGIDFGLKTFLTFNDGSRIESPLFYLQYHNELKKLNKQLSKKLKGSNNWKKTCDRLFRKYQNIINKRRDHQFKLSKYLTEKYDHIFIEDLNIKAMQQMWGKKISDLSFSSFISILEYQSSKNKSIVHKINKWFPSSKTCHLCGTINENLTLKDRIWKCDCGIEHDRDVNAAINILREGASSLGLDNVIPEF